MTVHFVPHSHLDAGWLKTFDEYYDWSVRQIFRNVFREMTDNKNYTYTVGDIAFFRRFYQVDAHDLERE